MPLPKVHQKPSPKLPDVLGSMKKLNCSQNIDPNEEIPEKKSENASLGEQQRRLSHVLIPQYLEKKILHLLNCYPDGLELEKFTYAFSKRFGEHLIPAEHGFGDIIDLLNAMSDKVSRVADSHGRQLLAAKERDKDSRGGITGRIKKNKSKQSGVSCERASSAKQTAFKNTKEDYRRERSAYYIDKECIMPQLPEEVFETFKSILKDHKGGIMLANLIPEYEMRTHRELILADFGFSSVFDFVSVMKDIFKICKKDNHYVLYDPGSVQISDSSYDFKGEEGDQDHAKRLLSIETQERLMYLLQEEYPGGLSTEEIIPAYRGLFGATLDDLNPMLYGYRSLIGLLNAHSDLVVLQYCNDSVMVQSSQVHLKNETISPTTLPAEAVPFGSKYKGLDRNALLPIGELVDVVIAEVYSPQKFWVVHRGINTSQALDCLMDRMFEFYNGKIGDRYLVPNNINIGAPVAALYADDGNYYRALITAIEDLTTVRLFLIDYGTMYRCDTSYLRLLHRQYFQLPAQAVRAALDEIEPVDGRRLWSKMASNKFVNLIQNKGLVAHIKQIKEGSVYMDLWDTSGADDINIASVLIEGGWARTFHNSEDGLAETGSQHRPVRNLQNSQVEERGDGISSHWVERLSINATCVFHVLFLYDKPYILCDDIVKLLASCGVTEITPLLKQLELPTISISKITDKNLYLKLLELGCHAIVDEGRLDVLPYISAYSLTDVSLLLNILGPHNKVIQHASQMLMKHYGKDEGSLGCVIIGESKATAESISSLKEPTTDSTVMSLESASSISAPFPGFLNWNGMSSCALSSVGSAPLFVTSSIHFGCNQPAVTQGAPVNTCIPLVLASNPAEINPMAASFCSTAVSSSAFESFVSNAPVVRNPTSLHSAVPKFETALSNHVKSSHCVDSLSDPAILTYSNIDRNRSTGMSRSPIFSHQHHELSDSATDVKIRFAQPSELKSFPELSKCEASVKCFMPVVTNVSCLDVSQSENKVNKIYTSVHYPFPHSDVTGENRVSIINPLVIPSSSTEVIPGDMLPFNTVFSSSVYKPIDSCRVVEPVNSYANNAPVVRNPPTCIHSEVPLDRSSAVTKFATVSSSQFQNTNCVDSLSDPAAATFVNIDPNWLASTSVMPVFSYQYHEQSDHATDVNSRSHPSEIKKNFHAYKHDGSANNAVKPIVSSLHMPTYYTSEVENNRSSYSAQLGETKKLSAETYFPGASEFQTCTIAQPYLFDPATCVGNIPASLQAPGKPLHTTPQNSQLPSAPRNPCRLLRDLSAKGLRRPTNLFSNSFSMQNLGKKGRVSLDNNSFRNIDPSFNQYIG